MFWEAIIGNELVGPFKAADGMKATAELYINFIKEHFVSWQWKKNLLFGIRWYPRMIMPCLMLQVSSLNI